jgi:hypothetical protein
MITLFGIAVLVGIGLWASVWIERIHKNNYVNSPTGLKMVLEYFHDAFVAGPREAIYSKDMNKLKNSDHSLPSRAEVDGGPTPRHLSEHEQVMQGLRRVARNTRTPRDYIDLPN